MSNRVAFGWLIILLAAAALIRFAPIRWGTPIQTEPDTFIAEHVEFVRSGRQGIDPSLSGAQYPHLIARLAMLLPDRETDPDRLQAMTQEQHLDNAAWPIVRVRLVVATLSLLAIPACFFIARAFVPNGYAVLAAALVAGSLLLTNLAQQCRPHAVLTALIASSIALALRCRRRPTLGNFLLAGFAAAGSFACLHTGVLALLPILAAFALSRGAGRSWFDPRILVPLALVASAFPIFYSDLYDPAIKQASVDGVIPPQTHQVTFGWWLQEFLANLNPLGILRVVRILSSWEPVLALVCVVALLAGALAWLRKGRACFGPRTRDALVVLAYGIPYLMLVATFGKTYERFLTTLVPLLACLAAVGLHAWGRRASPQAWTQRIACALVLCGSVSAAIKLAWIRSRPGTLEETTQFLRQHLEKNGHVALSPPTDVALARSKPTLYVDPRRQVGLFSPWAHYQAALPEGMIAEEPHFHVEWYGLYEGSGDLNDPAQLERFVAYYGPGFFVIDPERDRKHSHYRRVRAQAAKAGKLLARFSPDSNPLATDISLSAQDREYPDMPNATWRILRARAFGPVIEVYQVPAPN